MEYKIVKKTRVGLNVTYEYEGMSSYEKPSTPPDMSKLKEVDTGEQYFYSAKEQGWIKPSDKYLDHIIVTNYPSKMTYIEGDYFNPSGMIVMAFYTDNSQPTVIEDPEQDDRIEILVPSNPLTLEGTTEYEYQDVTINYRENGITRSYTISITVTQNYVQDLSFDLPPKKTIYKNGETSDLTGSRIIATMANGDEIDVTNQCVPSTEAVTISSPTCKAVYNFTSYSGSVYSYFATYPVTVLPSNAVLESIEFEEEPRTSYYEEQYFYTDGSVINARFTGEHSAYVTNECVFTPADGQKLTLNDTSVTASYTFDGVTKTATLPLTVLPTALSGIGVETYNMKTDYDSGEALDLTGIRVSADYTNNTSHEISPSLCTFTPPNGTILTNTTSPQGEWASQDIVASYTEDGVTKTYTFSVYVTAV